MKHLKTFENFSNTDINEEIDWKALGQKIGLIKDPVKKKAATLDAINKHPVKKKNYEQFLKENPEKAEKYLEFWMENPDEKYCKWDDKKNMFVKATTGAGVTGLMSAVGSY